MTDEGAPLRVAAASANGDGWAAVAKACADQLDGHPATLGFLYVTDRLSGDLPSILTFLRERTGIADWVGSVGLGICAAGWEAFDTPAAAVLALDVPESRYRMLPLQTSERDIETLRQSGWCGGFHPGLGIVHGDPANAATPEMIEQLSRLSDCYLVGGLASAYGDAHQIAGTVVHGGLSGVMLDSGFAVAAGLTQGCAPCGPVHRVTGAIGNIVVELDGRSAFATLLEDVGIETSDRNLERRLRDIHVALLVEGSDTGDYMVRNLMGIGPDEGLIAVGDTVERGDRLMFCERNAASARRDLDRMLADLKTRTQSLPRAGLYFSCTARGPNLFDGDCAELRAIRETIGDFPLVGFFGNGEVCHDRLYGYTGVLTLFL